MEYNNLKILGGGGFGTIYDLQNGTVLKAMHGENNCDDAKLEFIKQKKIFDSFNRLRSLKKKGKDNFILKIIQKHVVISRPHLFNIKPIIVNGTFYSCMFVMDKLYGLPLSFYLKEHPEFKNGFFPEFLEDLDYDVQCHIALSDENLKYGFYPVNVNKKISANNPLRGYFLSEKDTKLINNIPWSVQQLKQIIGFIYGWIYFDANILPLDVEITLGVYDGDYKINVLDFGLTFDLEDLNNNIRNTLTDPYFKLMNESSPENSTRDIILQKMIEAISIDFYADLETDEDAKIGFDLAKELSQKF
jgi:hypothetical protein